MRTTNRRLGFVLAALASGALAVAACNAVDTHPNGPAVLDGGGSCSTAPTLTCDAVAAGHDTCTANGQGAGNIAALPTDASFPVGCQAYFRGADCSSRGYCTCDGPDDAGAAAVWNCHEPSDD